MAAASWWIICSSKQALIVPMIPAFRERKAKQKEYTDALKVVESKRSARPGKIAWVHDLKPTPPTVHLLLRGNYSDPGPVVTPGAPRGSDRSR